MAIDISEKIGQEAIAFTFKNHPKNYFDKSNPLKLLSSNDDKEALIKKQGINKIIFQDFSSEFSEIKTPEFFLYLKNKFGCKHIVCGQNFSFGHDRINDEKTLKNIARDLKLNITLVPLLSINGETVSSTLIRTSLSKGNVKKAADMLGRSYSVISAVEHGRRIGSMMGFPTVNLKDVYKRQA